jgi:formylglycine-generating enzyme required for sulfatase activity
MTVFEYDIFISYACIDNQPLTEEQKGWISDLHRALETRLAQLRGEQPKIWRDLKLQGNDFFGDTIVELFPKVALLVPVLSPQYIKSEWCTRELREFCRAAERTGGVRIAGNRARIFKVIKTPVPHEQQPLEVQTLLNYEFYQYDPAGRLIEFSWIFGTDAKRDFWFRLNDLAYDIFQTLEILQREQNSAVAVAKLTMIRYVSQNRFYDEPFAEDVLPLHMMLIPSGTFFMGSPETELEYSDSESPQRKVTLSQFFMSKYPVTQAQWRFVAELPQVDRELESDPSRFKGDKRPVEQVSWYDAAEFCERLSIYTGRAYRLPTEAEWEYACRAGTTTPFYFGETITTDLANYRGTDNEELKWSGSYGQGPKGEYREETTPVDQFEGANAFGLGDMHGNVLEWCQDRWHDNYQGVPTDGSAWLTDDENTSRVYRGGSWFSPPRNCRSAYRLYYGPDSRNDVIGFRVCCSGPRTP